MKLPLMPTVFSKRLQLHNLSIIRITERLRHLSICIGEELSSIRRRRRRRRRGSFPLNDVPRGFVAVQVGSAECSPHARFVIPVSYLNHPLFEDLLKQAEEEFGFEREGCLRIPCKVVDFEARKLQILLHHHQRAL